LFRIGQRINAHVCLLGNGLSKRKKIRKNRVLLFDLFENLQLAFLFLMKKGLWRMLLLLMIFLFAGCFVLGGI